VAPRLLRRAQPLRAQPLRAQPLRAQPLRAGRVVSGDALYCQRARCRQIRAAGGDYRFAVKANQPDLLDDVALLFRAPPPGAGARCGGARTVDKHGGRLEERRLRASATLAGYLQAAGGLEAGLVLEGATSVRWPGHPARPPRQEVRYFLSRLPATWRPLDLLALTRRHGHIEHRLHYVRDVTLGEDACQVRSGRAPQVRAPQVRAALRNAALGLLRQHRVPNLAARVPNLAARVRVNAWAGPVTVLGLLGLKL
jgi:predicted transposase YbfD/YdcC